MKVYMSVAFIALIMLGAGAVYSADEETSKMDIEKIIQLCEEQYAEDKYPDVDERNKLIDQCIDENTPASPQPQD